MDEMSPAAYAEMFVADNLPEGYDLYLKKGITPEEAVLHIVYELLMRRLLDLKQKNDIWHMQGESGNEWWMSPQALGIFYKLVREITSDSQGRSDYPRRSVDNKMLGARPRVVIQQIRHVAAASPSLAS
jgi:hypothetical protein